jgi:uncharacterized protein YjbI with pentapeptide repeats
MNIVYLDLEGNTPLIRACIANDIEEAREILESPYHHRNSPRRNAQRLNPGNVNNEGKTALIYACEHHNNELALLLLRTDASNPEHETPEGKTALQIAQESPHMQEFILEMINGDYLSKIELYNFDFIEGKISVSSNNGISDLMVSHCNFSNFDEINFHHLNNGIVYHSEFINSKIKNTDFEFVGFNELNIAENSSITGCSFNQCQIKNSNIVDDVYFRRCHFFDCEFNNVFLSNMVFIDVTFENMSFSGTVFDNVFFQDVNDRLFNNTIFENCSVRNPEQFQIFGLTREQRIGLGLKDDNSIPSTPSTPIIPEIPLSKKLEALKVIKRNEKNETVANDMFEGLDLPIKKILKNTEENSKVFITEHKRAFVLSQDQIEYYLNDRASWFYECIGELLQNGNKKIEYNKKKRYIALALGGDLGFKVLVSYKELKELVNSRERIFYIYEKPKFTHTISEKATGVNANWISANHCQAGSDYKVYKIEAFSATPPRKSLTRRRTNSLKKTKSKTKPKHKRTTLKRVNTI